MDVEGASADEDPAPVAGRTSTRAAVGLTPIVNMRKPPGIVVRTRLGLAAARAQRPRTQKDATAPSAMSLPRLVPAKS